MALRFVSAALFLTAIAGMSLEQSASAQEQLDWHGWSGEGSASLVYGVAESDYVLISLSCEKAGSPIRLVYPYEPEQPTDGGTYTLTLTSGGETVSLTTAGTRLEMDDLFILEGELPKGSNLVGLLTGGETLSVGVGKDATQLPLKGAATAASALFEICGR